MQPQSALEHGPRLRAAVLLLLAVLCVAASGVRSARAADNPAPWSIAPSANDFGADRPSYGYTIDPGGHVEDGVVVVNHGTAPLQLALYAADDVTTPAGRLDFAAAGARSKGVGAWVHPGRAHITVRPGNAVEVPLAIAVPANASPGDYMGGIVTTPAQAGEGDGIDAERRVGVQIRLRVGGALQPSLAVDSLHVDFAHSSNPLGKGDATVTYAIHNTGNAILTARQAVSVAGPFDRGDVSAGAIPDSPALLPGDSWKVSVPVDGVAPALRLTATVTLVALLTDAAGSTAPLAATQASGHAWAIPWALLAAVAVLCGLVALGLLALRRRRRDGAPLATDHAPSEL